MRNLNAKLLTLFALLIFSASAYGAGTAIWNAADRAPATGTERIPVDTSSSSSPGRLQVSDISTYTLGADTEINALRQTTAAADALPYFTSASAASTTTLTSFARTLIDDTTQGAMQTTLGLVPGTNVQAFDSDLTTWAGITPASGIGTFLATPSSANLASAVTNETGSGLLVFATSPALTTPNLGTPSAVTLTNGTGLPVSTGISGLGTGVATWLATPSSANLASALTGETGSGSAVFGTSPTITTANITTSSLRVPNSTTLPGTCTVGDAYMDTDATTGQRWYLCESTNTWAVQGGAGGGGAFSAITSGTNTTAAMVVGTGASLATSGSGTIAATSAPLSGISGLGTGVGTFLGTPSSANLASAVTDETGSGALVFATSPAFTTPNLGTPSAATLTNATGLPISTGVSGLGTGVATFLGTPSSGNLASALTDETGSGAAVFATSPAFTTPNLGTPSAATLTNATGLPISTGVSGLGTGVATFLATPSSANQASMLTDETGTGADVFAGSPTFTGTPVLADPRASSMLIGHTATLTLGGGVSGQFQDYGSTAATGTSVLGMFNATAATDSELQFYRSKNASIGSATVVASGDDLGSIGFYGAQQTGTLATVNKAAGITALVDGTVTSGAGADMPGRLELCATADGSGTCTTRLTVGSTALTSAVPLAMGSNSITMTGSLAATGARVTKGWFTDVESTNAPTVGGSAVYYAGGTDVGVADGGTGVSSLTAYAPLFGGTTGTGAIQSGTVGSSGQVLKSNGAGALPTFQTDSGATTITAGTALSGTSTTITGIPSTATHFVIFCDGCSTSGSSLWEFRLGDSGGVENTGYLAGESELAGSTTTTSSTSGFVIRINSASVTAQVRIQCDLYNAASFSWACTGTAYNTSGTVTTHSFMGTKSTSAALDRVSITSQNGTDTGDAGTMYVSSW